MGAPIEETDTWDSQDFDMIIDVRSPSEFANDHIPGAINLPVLSDEERVVVGTMYKQISAFEARKAGAVLVARNIATHIETRLKDYPSDFTPLVHCWRGGQRSQSFARICSEIGWRSYVLSGGYKKYRHTVIESLDTLSNDLSFIVLAGRTGTRKTDILLAMAKRGAQVLDLEGLASHRGSLLGHIKDEPQPSQRLFESSLAHVLRGFEPSKPVYVESESSRVGNIELPKALWKQITAAPQITTSAPREARATYLLENYAHLTQDKTDLDKFVDGMVHRYGHEQTDHWRSLMDANAWAELANELLKIHYDPAYDRSLKRHSRTTLGEIVQSDHNDATFANTVEDILKI